MTKPSKPTKPRLQRDKVIAVITKEARRLERENNHAYLFELLGEGGLSWVSNRSRTTKEIASVLIAAAAFADDDELEATAHTAILRREEAKGATCEAADAIASRAIARLGARFAACGCLESMASDLCCARGAEARRALQAQATELLKALGESHDPKLYAEAVADLSKLVDAHKCKEAA